MTANYRGTNKHRKSHPKIFVFSHTKVAEISYFKSFRDHLKTTLLIVRQKICRTPHQLIYKVIKWKNENREVEEKDGDQVWCIIDVDDFYKNNPKLLLDAIKEANKNNIKIAFANECFENWILLHFEKLTLPVQRGDEIETRIAKMFRKNKLGTFKKNQSVFSILLPFQEIAKENSRSLLKSEYEKIDWPTTLSDKGNPSTNIHFLVDEINRLKSDEN